MSNATPPVRAIATAFLVGLSTTFSACDWWRRLPPPPVPSVITAEEILRWYASLLLLPTQVVSLPYYLPGYPVNSLLTKDEVSTVLGVARDQLWDSRYECVALGDGVHTGHLCRDDISTIDRVLIGEGEWERARVSGQRFQDAERLFEAYSFRPRNVVAPPRSSDVLYRNPEKGAGREPRGRGMGATLAIEYEIFDPPASVADLVSYRWYANRVEERLYLPPGMSEVLVQELRSLSARLPNQYVRRLRDVAVTLEPPEPTAYPLWANAWRAPGGKGYQISVAPAVIRAAFMIAMNHEAAWIVSMALTSPASDLDLGRTSSRISRSLDENPEWPGRVASRFRSTVRFALAHELAHVYLGHTDRRPTSQAEVRERERDADCHATAHLHYVGLDPSDLGLFDELLDRAVQQGEAHLWGVHELGDAAHVRERIAWLKSHASELSFGNIDSACTQH